MFCSKCGENLVEGAIFCQKCGNKVTGVVHDSVVSVVPHSDINAMKEKKKKYFKYVVMGCALLLCILYFTASAMYSRQ
jgi:uncharacterized membrane protein YvbJ